MLQDIERKVLRIIHNYLRGRWRLPTIHELTIKTGRNRGKILEVLEELNRERYIIWSPIDPEKMELLEAEERKPIVNNGWKAYGSN
ncbi:hypothetical protein [Paenibacillus radicis (ex Xue et al. 2023)]|uniref:MarR family transcriptional regulator n=1 Tax=Paenibacillus radicis (ex Xue et al. 2023) TaxID=2972489 RepID=A0ABT1YRD7_9BACL|nr:hypothetical protein [Paenibacillus radicis (ex Xue et al. 2023)]MCR8635731.1 hypothetical protein [Paenibacillus radicis (ex Xue et al. 2023)]